MTAPAAWTTVRPISHDRRSDTDMAARAHRTHRVAVVLFADVPGASAHDASNRFLAALRPVLCPPLPAQPGIPAISVLDLVELNTAARNGYLTLGPATRLPYEKTR
jgi:hypothetical protein